MRPPTTLLMLALSAALLFGCDDKKAEAPASETAEKSKPEPLAPTEGKFSIGDFKVRPSAGALQAEGAPDAEAVRARVVDALYESPAFEKGGPRELDGSLMYDIRADGEGWDVMLYGGLGSPNAKFEAGVGFKSSDEANKGKSLDELVSMSISSLSEQLRGQAVVMSADGTQLAKMLERDDVKEEEKLIAIQEIRERDLKDAIPAVRKYLAPDHSSKLRTAAAATLVYFGDDESHIDIIKVAEDLSREKDPQYVPMLHILADMGGQEATTYLETVADAHSAPAVRAVAAEALRELKEGKK